MFVQDIFINKLNRYLPNFQWFGIKDVYVGLKILNLHNG